METLTKTEYKEFQTDSSLKITGVLPKKNPYKRSGTYESSINGSVYHKNYLEYLQMCWSHHYGIIVTPDILWHLYLCEISAMVNEYPEDFRSIFASNSKEDGKTTICIPTSIPGKIDLDLLINEIQKNSPVDVNTFIIKFTTTNLISELAMNAAFCDMVSSFFEYTSMSCGISKLKLYGNEEDYEKLYTHAKMISELFSKTLNADYFNKAAETFKQILNAYKNNDIEFWRNIFEIIRCGSGGEMAVGGWIGKLLFNSEYHNNEFASNLVSVVKYSDQPTGRKFEKHVGLFSSNIEDDYLCPEFSHIDIEHV